MNKQLVTAMMAIATTWAAVNAAFVIGWEVAANWQHLAVAWPEIAFAAGFKVWAIQAGYVLAMGLLWAICPAGKSQSPCGPSR